MKKLLLLLFILGNCFAGMYAASNLLLVSLSDETTVDIVMSDDLKISFDDENLIAKGTHADVTIPKNTVLNITHTDSNSVQILPDDKDFEFNNGLIFHNLPSNSIISVCDANGKTEISVTAQGEYAINADVLQPGVHIVRVNGKSYKIFKK